MPTIQLPFETLLEATEQLDVRELETLAHRLTVLRRNHKKLSFEREVRELKEKCDLLTLSPSQWARYFQLVDARRSGTASEAQRREFLKLAEHAEKLSVNRLELVAEFAARHKTSLAEATRKLGLKAPEPVVV